MRKSIFEGMAAGIMIGIGGSVFCACEDKVVGAILFTVGLLSICLMGLQLFTGKVGFLVASHTKADLLSLAGCLIGNALGTFLCGVTVYLGRNPLAVRAAELVEAKLQLSLPAVFLSAVLCGILMYTAVYCYRVKNTVAAILFCVPVFILSGFEHSIADMFYFFAALSFNLPSLVFIVVVILGNSVGGMLLPALVALGHTGDYTTRRSLCEMDLDRENPAGRADENGEGPFGKKVTSPNPSPKNF